MNHGGMGDGDGDEASCKMMVTMRPSHTLLRVIFANLHVDAVELVHH